MNPRVFKRRYLRAHGISPHFEGSPYHYGTAAVPHISEKLEAKRKKKRAMERASRRANRRA